MESCQWRIIIPCETEEMCTEEPLPTDAPVVEAETGTPFVTLGDDEYDDTIWVDDGGNDDTIECPEDVLIIAQTGSTDFPMEDAVEIVSQNGTTVTVDLYQAWTAGSDAEKVDYIYTYYRESMFNHHCFNHSNVEEGSFDTITITCNVFNPKGYVQICVADKEDTVLSAGDDGEVPDCCKPTPSPDSHVVCYTLEINCVSECIDEAQGRERTLLQRAGGWFFNGEQ